MAGDSMVGQPVILLLQSKLRVPELLEVVVKAKALRSGFQGAEDELRFRGMFYRHLAGQAIQIDMQTPSSSSNNVQDNFRTIHLTLVAVSKPRGSQRTMS